MLTKKMVKSEAWEKLDVYDMGTFLHIAIEFNGDNKDDLSLTYKEARWLMGEHRFKQSIDNLVNYGFLDVVRSGGVWKKCNIYALSERWRRYGTGEFIKGKRFVIDTKKNCDFQIDTTAPRAVSKSPYTARSAVKE